MVTIWTDLSYRVQACPVARVMSVSMRVRRNLPPSPRLHSRVLLQSLMTCIVRASHHLCWCVASVLVCPLSPVLLSPNPYHPPFHQGKPHHRPLCMAESACLDLPCIPVADPPLARALPA